MLQQKLFHLLTALVLLASAGAYYIYTLTITVPTEFPVNKVFTIDENEKIRSVSMRLETDHYVTSALLFRALISARGKDRHLKAGGYTFTQGETIYGIVDRFASGHPDTPLVSLTIPEGSTIDDIASLISKALPSVSKESVMSIIEKNNLAGKLFPSTYFLMPSNTAESIINLMKKTFENKYGSFVGGLEIPAPLTSNIEVLSLAAILEGEAKTKEDMEIIAGILLTRLKKGMPLQVDVAKETYTAKGLPAVPINNPGEVAISAVFHASSSPYLFYLTGKDGKMYYATTFEEHKKNIAKYLR